MNALRTVTAVVRGRRHGHRWAVGLLTLTVGLLALVLGMFSGSGAVAVTPTEPTPSPAPTPSPVAAPTAAAAAAPPPPASPSPAPTVLPERFTKWLEEVDMLITQAERMLFLSLSRDYQRDAFIQQFWRVRDPHLRTARNELKERWPERVATARSRYGSLTDDRSRILLVHGEPDATVVVKCTATRSPAEIWLYQGSDQLDFAFLLIFLRSQLGQGEARVFRPQNDLAYEELLNRARACINGRQLTDAINLVMGDSLGYERTLQAVLAKPRPRSVEWIYTFVASSTDLPVDAQPLAAAVDFAFPGRYQNRTVVEGLLQVQTADVVAGEFAGYASYDFQLTGDVVLGDTLFESFRYKFGCPRGAAGERIPLAFQRMLRPGTYKLILRLDDLNSNRIFRQELELAVPQTEERVSLPTFKDPVTAKLFAEATAALAAGENAIHLVPPAGDLHTGFTRFDTLVTGNLIQSARFFLDDKYLLTKNRPPFNVEIDLGAFPDLHTLRVLAFDGQGNEVASDELLLNSGGYRFAVKLVEPRKGKRYTNSLQAKVEVEVPNGRSLDRIELFLNETLVATLYQEPYVHPVILPAAVEVAYVRAVAYLPDGNSTESLVFINAPDYLEELEIQFVELYTTVLDRQGRPVSGLSAANFTVSEDGVRQQITRFETVENLSIHAGILIDNSASMMGTLEDVRRAALSFFDQAIQPKDRAAVITFNSFPHLAVELTNDRTALGSGLAGLVAEGQTALYDSLMFSLYYFAGIKGQRAILVLSDGKDESSRFTFAETLEYARHAGITIYSIGLRLDDLGARQKLTTLADETGGRSFFIRDISGLAEIYQTIQKELRSQYLIAYQSSNTRQGNTFRAVNLEVDVPEAEVKTLSGYYP